MFRNNHKPLVEGKKCPKFEDTRGVDVSHYQYVNVEKDGELVQEIRRVVVNTAVPMTPQSGNDVHIGDLGHMISTKMALPHEPVYLTQARMGNPFESSRFARELSRIGNNVADDLEKQKNKK